MLRIYGKLKEIIDPEAYVVVTKIGDVIIIEKCNPKEILREIWKKFEDLSDDEKKKLALDAKKWT